LDRQDFGILAKRFLGVSITNVKMVCHRRNADAARPVYAVKLFESESNMLCRQGVAIAPFA
jgi:hypothetical protein